MRIGLLTTEYPTEPFYAGGLASYVRRVATALTAAGHDAEVFVLAESDERYLDGSVWVNRVKVGDTWSRRFRGRTYLWKFPGMASILDRASAFDVAVRRRSAEVPIDVVQSPDLHAPGLFLGLRARIPVATRISHYSRLWQHAYEWPLTSERRQQNLCEMLQLHLSGAVYGPSQFLASRIAQDEHLKVDVLRPPFDAADIRARARSGRKPQEFAPADYALFFGSIGRLKGADRLANVLPDVLSRCGDMHFVFAGNVMRDAGGKPYDGLIRERLGALSERVTIFGALRHDELLPLVAGARFVVLPSRIDNLPNACMEAMALQRPVIATRGASFEELVEPGVSGALVDQDDSSDLARTMVEFWELPAERLCELGRAGAARMETFGPTRTLPPLLDLLGRVARGAPHSVLRRSVLLADLCRRIVMAE